LSGSPPAATRDRPRFLLRARINLHGLVFVMSGFAVLYAVYRIAELVPVVPYQPTYHAAEFVVERATAAWADGHVEPGGTPIQEPVIRTLGGSLVLMNDRAVAAVAGQRMRIWFSSEDDAPVVSVANMRCIPDNRMLGFWLVFAVGALGTGLRLTRRAGRYLQRTCHAERIG
jgi:prepilin-type processing-associated H-X9-DG protein